MKIGSFIFLRYMRALLFTSFVLLFPKLVLAEAGLDNIVVVLTLIPFGVICLLALLIISLKRFDSKTTEPSASLTIFGILLIICSLSCIVAMGLMSIDPGFLAVCIIASALSILLIILNYKL